MSERTFDAALKFNDGTVITLRLDTVDGQFPTAYTYPFAHRDITSGAEAVTTEFKLSGMTPNNAANYEEVTDLPA